MRTSRTVGQIAYHDRQSTNIKIRILFKLIFSEFKFSKIRKRCIECFQNAEVNTLDKSNLLSSNPDSAVFTLKASEKAGAGTVVARIK